MIDKAADDLLMTQPAVEPSVVIGNTKVITNYMKSHQLDIGIIEGSFKMSEGMYAEQFAEDEMVAVVSSAHQLAQKSTSLTVDERKKERWILREEGSGTREAAEEVFIELLHNSKEMIELKDNS